MSFEFFPAVALFYQERWRKVLRWWEGTAAFFCADCSLHNLLKVSTDTAFDLGVINHCGGAGRVLLAVLLFSCRTFSTPGA